MKTLFWGSALFCIAFLLHLVVWKVRIPQKQTKALLQIFFGTLIIGILTLWVTSSLIISFSLLSPESFPEYFHIFLFFSSLAFGYIITYSGVEADSPSLLMVMKIAKSAPDGFAKEKLFDLLSDDLLIKPRMRDLVNVKMLYIDGEKYKLTVRGILFVRVFILYRKLLNLPKGG